MQMARSGWPPRVFRVVLYDVESVRTSLQNTKHLQKRSRHPFRTRPTPDTPRKRRLAHFSFSSLSTIRLGVSVGRFFDMVRIADAGPCTGAGLSPTPALGANCGSKPGGKEPRQRLSRKEHYCHDVQRQKVETLRNGASE